MTTKRVVMFSSGAGSWGAARRVADRHGTDGLVLLFADTLIEDSDNYRFLDEAAADVGGELVVCREGRDPWQVFKDVRFVGNTRIDPCSRILKRELLRKWLDENCDPASTVVYLGLDWTEQHRADRAAKYWAPWIVEHPLTEPPLVDKADVLADLRARGIEPPRLYELGFPHANCGGFCVKAGQAHFELLLATMPERYAEHEAAEESLRVYLDKDIAILRDRRGGKLRPLTMRALRERVEADGDQGSLDWGGCGCFSDYDDDDAQVGPDEASK